MKVVLGSKLLVRGKPPQTNFGWKCGTARRWRFSSLGRRSSMLPTSTCCTSFILAISLGF